MKVVYDKIKKILKKFVVVDEEYYHIMSLWVIGTYFHKRFRSYPYLFLNAMKGSGKTRTLNLLSRLSNNGKMLVDMTEAVLFRTAEDNALFIDELENINNKEKGTMRLLLLSSYKQGIVVRRMKRVEGEWVVEEFKLYTPICIANIEGMDDVLQDRCITMILEKSFSPYVTRMIEDWDSDPDIIDFTLMMKDLSISPYMTKNSVECVESVGVEDFFLNIPTLWNELIYTHYTHITHSTHSTHSTLPTQPLEKVNSEEFVKKISEINQERIGMEITNDLVTFIRKLWDSNLNGRDMEIFLPLIAIAHAVDKDLVDTTIKIAEDITEAKKMEDVVENRDMSFISFLIEYIRRESLSDKTFVQLKHLRSVFEDDEKQDWLSNIWIGKALKRLNLYIEKKRSAGGVLVRLDTHKIIRTAKKLGISTEDIDTTEELTITEVIDAKEKKGG